MYFSAYIVPTRSYVCRIAFDLFVRRIYSQEKIKGVEQNDSMLGLSVQLLLLLVVYIARVQQMVISTGPFQPMLGQQPSAAVSSLLTLLLCFFNLFVRSFLRHSLT